MIKRQKIKLIAVKRYKNRGRISLFNKQKKNLKSDA